jgi:eukaryotic-like serine/threonine-protein kinase
MKGGQAEAHATGALPRGRTVAGRYEVESVLGEGASGVVYLAREVRSGTRVALKVIHPELCHDRQISKRFQREAEILKRLEGPHLVKLLDFVEEGELLAIALEYVDATSLETTLHAGTPVDLGFAVEVTLQVCAALGVAHAAGVVHRDLKPGNVLIERATAEAPGPSVRVVDFGLAKVVHGEKMTTGLTEHDMIFGTPEYMAPEQARGDEVDARCDIYAAGIMLYEMAVGEVPFRGRSPIAAMTAHLTQEPPPPRSARPERGISPALEAVILRALAKAPSDRYPNARAFAEALAAARDQKRVVAPHRPGDPAALGVSDTELSLSTTGLAHRPTLPADVVSHSPTVPSPQAEPPPRRPTPKPAPPEPEELALATTERQATGIGGRWVWTIVAVLALALGITIGAFLGGR